MRYKVSHGQCDGDAWVIFPHVSDEHICRCVFYMERHRVISVHHYHGGYGRDTTRNLKISDVLRTYEVFQL